MTDEELVVCVVNGTKPESDKAFNELVSRYQTPLTDHFARRLHGDTNRADDAVQQTLIRVFLNIGTFDPAKGSFRLWIFCIARNESKRVAGHRELRHASVEGNNLDPEKVAPPLENDLDAQAWVRKVHAFVERLPENLRKAMMMVFYDNQGYEDAAENAGVNVRTMFRRIKEGVGRLKEHMGDCSVNLANVTLDRRFEPRRERSNPFTGQVLRIDPGTATLRQCLESMEGRDFEVLDLISYQDVPITEVSDRLGLPESTIREMLARATARMSERLLGKRDQRIAEAA